MIPRNRRKASSIGREGTRARRIGHVARKVGRGLSRWGPAEIWLRGGHQGILTRECLDLAFCFKIALFAVYNLGAEQTWVPILACPSTICVTSGNCVNFSEIAFSRLCSGALISPHRTVVRIKWDGPQDSACSKVNASGRHGSLSWTHDCSLSTPAWALGQNSGFGRCPRF